MKVYYFSEFPYHEYPDEDGEKYPSLRLTFPNTYFDPSLANGLFQRYFDECMYVDEMGFDGWQLSSTSVLENGALLVGFQKESS